MSRGAN